MSLGAGAASRTSSTPGGLSDASGDFAGAPMLAPFEPPQWLAEAHQDEDATEAALLIAHEVADEDEMPDEVVADLTAMLEHLVAQRMHSTAVLRLGHLRLLIELVEGATKGFIRRDDYDRSRARARELHGRDYPDSSTLARYYGGWLKAVASAAAWLLHGGSARVKVNKEACVVHVSYDVQAIRSGILRARLDIGDWPTEWEWTEWARLTRLLSSTDPRLPGMKAIRTAYSSFDDAVADTRASYERSVAASGRASSEAAL